MSGNQICAHQGLCPPISLCLLLKTLDGIPDFWGIVPTGSGPLPKNPSTRGTDSKAEFGIGEGLQQGGVNYLALLLQDLELPSDLHPPLEQLIGVQVCQMGELVFLFRRQGLEQVLQGTWR